MDIHKVGVPILSQVEFDDFMKNFQEIFKKIYENHNEEVYLKDVVVFLRAVYENIDDVYEVR